MSEDAILSFNSVHKNLPAFYSKWREVSLPCHKPMGCNHPYFFGCTLHIFNHVLLLTDDYSLQRLFRFHPFNSDTHSVFEHAHIPSLNTHSGKCKRTCLKKNVHRHTTHMLLGDKLPRCCLREPIRGPGPTADCI